MRRRGCANRDLWGEDAIEAGVGGSGPDIAKGGGPTPLTKKMARAAAGGARPFGKKWRELPQNGLPPWIWKKMARATAGAVGGAYPLGLGKNGESYRRKGRPPWKKMARAIAEARPPPPWKKMARATAGGPTPLEKNGESAGGGPHARKKMARGPPLGKKWPELPQGGSTGGGAYPCGKLAWRELWVVTMTPLVFFCMLLGD